MHRFLLQHAESFEEIGKVGFWNIDSASGKVDWSYGMELMYGMPKGSFKGTSEDFIQRIHPDDVARNLRESQAALDARQPFDIRFRILRSDGAVRWVNTRGSARWGDGGTFLGASGIQLDVTEQMERDHSLRLQAQVMANMAEGVAILHPATGRLVYANPRIEQMLGYASGGMLGLHASDVNARSDQDPQTMARGIMAELSRLGNWRGEVHNRCADGREIWTTCTVSTFVHEELGPLWISVHTDITEQRLAQQARDAALADLRRLTLNVQESIEAERLALSREVHDQLGAALTGMRMQLEALATQLPTSSEVLANALLDVARTARDTQLVTREICTRLRPQMLDDVGLVEACRWYARDWSARTGIAVQGRFAKLGAEPDGKVATDLFRVLQELLTNVARHAGATRVRVSLSGAAAGLHLRVQDDGHGFDREQQTQGFGLMGVRERVRHHAGEFTLDSSPSGTQVRVRMQYLTTP
jgi:PAS domain S-box-containing protein